MFLLLNTYENENAANKKWEYISISDKTPTL